MIFIYAQSPVSDGRGEGQFCKEEASAQGKAQALTATCYLLVPFTTKVLNKGVIKENWHLDHF